MPKYPRGRIAILYICTGKYAVFWKKFYRSARKFLPDYYKDYYVFTDAPVIYRENDTCVKKIPQKLLGWPYDTLMRFDMFSQIGENLQNYDYIFFFNANSVIAHKIKAEEFLPEKENLVFVQHPGMYNKSNNEFTYERNPDSRAYIPGNQGQVYVCGGINGGRAKEYLLLIEELKRRIKDDLENGIIARYHDESHLNRYVYELKGNYRLLSPAYCYPEGWKMPFRKKVLILDKSRYFDVRELKAGKGCR